MGGGNVVAPASLDLVLDAFERGEFDLLAVGRALLANPDWANLVQAGESDRLKPCTLDALTRLY